MDDTSNKDAIEQQIEPWLRANVAFPNLQLHGRCNKLVLKQLSIDRKPQADVASFPVRLEAGGEDEYQPLLHSISSAAQRDANDMNQGVQTYGLYAYYPQDPTYVVRKIFRVASDTEVDRDYAPSEPPTEKGLVAQTMRHLEAVMRTNTVTMGYMMNAQQAEIRRQAEMIEAYSKQQTDFVVLLQDTLDNQHKRRLEERKEEIDLAVKEDLMGKLGTLLPYFVNRLAGTQIMPEQDRMLIMFGTFLENLSPDQQTSFVGGLDNNQRMAFMSILEEYEKKKGKLLASQTETIQKRFAKKELPPPNPNKSQSPPEPTSTSKKTQKQIAAPETEESDDVLVPEEKAQPVPLFMTLKERLNAPRNEKSSDPAIAKMEEDVSTFISRFRDVLSKPKSNGSE